MNGSFCVVFARSLILKVDHFLRRTPTLSEAGGPTRPNREQAWPARIRSSDFVRPHSMLITSKNRATILAGRATVTVRSLGFSTSPRPLSRACLNNSLPLSMSGNKTS